MILTKPETAEAYIANGLWGRVTLDAVFRRNAQAHPDRAALIEAGATGGFRNISYAEIDRRINLLSGFFCTVGLKPDTVVAVQMPVGAEAVIALLAGLRAGLIVAVVPELWRRSEMAAALPAVAPKALVTATRGGDAGAAERMRDIAADLFSVRFVCAFGDEVPDGVVQLDALDSDIETADAAAGAAVVRAGNSADHVATLSFAETPDGPAVLARSHNQWIATGMMHLVEARMDQNTRVLSPYHPLGLIGMSAALVPWLLTGGTLVLDRFTALDRLVGAAKAHTVGRVLLPAGLAAAASHRLGGVDDAAQPALSLVREPNAAETGGHDRSGTVIITRIGDIAAIPQAAEVDREPGALPLGSIGARPDDAEAACFLETRLHAIARRADSFGAPDAVVTAELGLRGPTIPDAGYPDAAGSAPLDWDEQGFLRTAMSARPSAVDTARFCPGSPLSDIVSVGGMAVAAEELDALCCAHSAVADAAVVALGDGRLGMRLCALVVPKAGETVTLDDLAAHLQSVDVAPHKIPVELRTVIRIPRGDDGRILRFTEIDRAAA